MNRFNFHNYDSLAHNESEKMDPRRKDGDREKDQIVALLFAAKAGDINTIRRQASFRQILILNLGCTCKDAI